MNHHVSPDAAWVLLPLAAVFLLVMLARGVVKDRRRPRYPVPRDVMSRNPADTDKTDPYTREGGAASASEAPETRNPQRGGSL